jgi:membrane protein
VTRPGDLLTRARATRGWRAWERYGRVRGNVLAGGIAYFAFFSLFPALAIGFTVFGLVLGGHADLQRRVAESVNTFFGGTTVIGTTPDRPGLVSMDQLVQGDVLTVTGLIGLIVLLLSGLGWVGALRDGLRAVFGRTGEPGPVAARLADLAVLVVVGLGGLASAAASVLVTGATGVVLDWVGISRGRAAGIAVSVLTSLVLLAVDTALFLLLFRLLAGVRPPLDDLFTAALAGGVALVLLNVFGGVLLRLGGTNKFLAASSLVVGLLVLLNLLARITLLAGAWAAATAADRGHLPDDDLVPAPEGGAATATKTPSGADVETCGAADGGRPGRIPVQPIRIALPERAADRTTLLAGAVLGATAAVGARVVGNAGRALRDVLRQD